MQQRKTSTITTTMVMPDHRNSDQHHHSINGSDKKASARYQLSPSVVTLAKISAIMLFLCFADCAAGISENVSKSHPKNYQKSLRKETDEMKKLKKISSCLSYGHSCWGAHGKRSDGVPSDKDNVQALPNLNHDASVILSKLFRGSNGGLRLYRANERQVPLVPRPPQLLFDNTAWNNNKDGNGGSEESGDMQYQNEADFEEMLSNRPMDSSYEEGVFKQRLLPLDEYKLRYYLKKNFPGKLN